MFSFTPVQNMFLSKRWEFYFNKTGLSGQNNDDNNNNILLFNLFQSSITFNSLTKVIRKN